MTELLDTGLRLPMSFLHWWLDELQGLLPRSLSPAPQRSKPSLILHLSGDATTLIERSPRLGDRELDRATSDELTISGLASSSFGDPRYRQWPIIIRLGGDLGLRKVVDLPSAARDDLGQLLHFELDRLTPFKADDVCFAWRILETDAAQGRMQVELEMTQKAVVERALALVKRHGREVDHVELDGDGQRAPLDLMPRSTEIGQGRRWHGRLLPLVALGLALIGIMLPLNKKQQLAARLERDIAAVRDDAEASLAIRDELDVLAAKARFLEATRNQRVTMTEVLAELTQTIPDHSHITQLQIRENSIELSGLADKASDLIAILDQSPLLASPAFQSPVTRDASSEKEHFQISVDLVKRTP